jgi:hypothetical protein
MSGSRSRRHDRQVPGPLCTTMGVTPAVVALRPPRGELPPLSRSYEPMRQTKTLTAASVIPNPPRLCRLSPTPCWEMVLHDVIACAPCQIAWTPTPQLSPGALARFFPEDIGLAQHGTGSTRRTIPTMQLQRGVRFRGCSHSLMFRLPGLLGPRVAPTAIPIGIGQLGRLRHARPGRLPGPGSGIAT